MISSIATLKDTLTAKNSSISPWTPKFPIYFLKRGEAHPWPFRMGAPLSRVLSAQFSFSVACQLRLPLFCFDGVVFIAGISRRGKIPLADV